MSVHSLRTVRWALPPAVLAVWLAGVAFLGVEARYAPAHAGVLVAVWALFAAAVWSGATLLRSAGQLVGIAGAFLLALTAVWQVRELTLLPGSLAVVVAISALAAWPIWRIALEPLGKGSWPRRLAATAAAALAFAIVAGAAWEGSRVMRWHLLRHNTFLGTPLWYLLEPTVDEVQAALFAARPLREGPPEAVTASLPAQAAPARSQQPGKSRPPNVVFVLLDTLRADALAAWGAAEPPMPKLDAFLAGGHRFTDVWANASWTRPSMASYFTGLLPEEHAARGVDDVLDDAFVTLAETFQDEGYATTAFMTNLAALSADAGFAQGFETYRELPGQPYARAEAVGRRVRQWLDAGVDGSRPALLYLHYLDPHSPYLAGDAPTRKTAPAYLAGYRRALGYLDDELATLLAELGERLPGETLFVVASDHGEQFFEHELFGHGHSLYGEVIHVPVALRWKGAPGGADLPQRLEARDFHRLLVAIARGEIGAADVPAWAARNERRRRYSSVYYSTTGRLALRPYQSRVCMRALEEGPHKVVWSAYGDTWELYDRDTDPGEQVNLAEIDPATVRRLSAAFDGEIGFWSKARALVLPPEAREQMRALGYLGD
jgi:hypothetical protein